ncbi:CST complex subunit TEN1 isoform X3 [Coffea arabica]|uniref:CST complex subunit TEN1 isoform X3 n=1 Tax=Coffea arabica TaxID=13443 RepID=A0ABM4X8B8_COFAR
MATSAVSFGALVTLEELVPSSSQFTQGASLRVTGKLQEYDIETAIASIVEGNASLKIDTQHLKVNLRIGSLYQFIGELLIDPSNQGSFCTSIIPDGTSALKQYMTLYITL